MGRILIAVIVILLYGVLVVGTSFFIVGKLFTDMNIDREIDLYTTER